MKTNDEPRLALSIRQPWAWLIVNGHKDIENRNWKTSFRGPIFIHAAKGMTPEEYESCEAMALRIRPTIAFPKFEELERGGIVGRARIVDCVFFHRSPWFIGDCGFVLKNCLADAFQPCRGMPGLFRPALPEGNR